MSKFDDPNLDKADQREQEQLENFFLKVKERVFTTDKAVLFDTEEGKCWVPKSQLITFNEVDMEAEIKGWFREKLTYIKE